MADFSHRSWRERYEPVPLGATPMYQTHPAAFVEHGSPGVSKQAPVSYTELDRPGTQGRDRKPGKRKSFAGKKRALYFSALVSFLVFGFNIAWLVWAKRKYGIANGYGTIQEGSCGTTKPIDLALHVLINMLSTCVLWGSHTFMQAFSSPTRQELDTAHKRFQWLHVGVLSMRNLLGGIAKRKAFVVGVLFLSSVPLHLLYNSMVFTTFSANEYTWAVVTNGYLQSQTWSVPSSLTPSILEMQQAYQSYDYYENDRCIDYYSVPFLTQNRNILLVSSETNATNSVLAAGRSTGVSEKSYAWMCSENATDSSTCNATAIDPTTWTVFNHVVDSGCYVEVTQEICAVQFSFTIMVVVLICNALKLSAMICVLIRYDAEDLLTCPGDAVASFLKCEDATTDSMCLVNERDVKSMRRQPRVAKKYTNAKSSYTQAASRRRWRVMFLLLAGVILLTVGLYVWAAWVLQKDDMSPGGMNFGSFNADALLLNKDLGNPASMSLLANLPQLILALLTLGMNGLLASLFFAKDFSHFAFQTGGHYLMVSSPSNKQQRSIWLLGMPPKPGLFILAMSIWLHWALSQSLFAVQGVVRRADGTVDPTLRVSNCAYSTSAMATAAVAFVILGLSVFYFTDPYVAAAWRRGLADHFSNNQRRRRREILEGPSRAIRPEMFVRKGHPPTFSTCSAAISASCHVPPQLRRKAMEEGPLRWGAVTSGQQREREREYRYGHCTLAPEMAWERGLLGPPTEGAWYAGTAVRRQVVLDAGKI